LSTRQLSLDAYLLDSKPRPDLSGIRRALVEFLWFGIKEARACLFAGLFFLAVFGVPRAGILGIPRYDLLLLIAVAIQAWMVKAKLETWDELKAITLFHVIGFGLEVFKTSEAIGSWSYPDFAYTKLFGVPLFSGFMYAAVGSYIIQSWRLFDIRIRHHPPYWMAGLVALAIYANFFTHHYIPDLRWYHAALALGLYARTTVYSVHSIATVRCRSCSGFSSSGSSSGWPRTSARSSGSGDIRISWGRGRRCTSESGARGRCWW
jgi:uncharacterized membrane protein YoaT (DUF817 family)